MEQCREQCDWIPAAPETCLSLVPSSDLNIPRPQKNLGFHRKVIGWSQHIALNSTNRRSFAKIELLCVSLKNIFRRWGFIDHRAHVLPYLIYSCYEDSIANSQKSASESTNLFQQDRLGFHQTGHGSTPAFLKRSTRQSDPPLAYKDCQH